MCKIILWLVIVLGLIILPITIYLYLANNNTENRTHPISFCDEVLKKTDLELVDMFEGVPSLVNFSSRPEAKLFRTVITKSAENGPNFAGHFTFISWGCGTSCFQYAIVDSITGNIVIYHENPVVDVLPSFTKNSRVLVFNPKEEFSRFFEGKDLDEILENNANEIAAGRTYFSLEEKEKDHIWLNTLCTEHVLDGININDI